jgi:hypothetical protein
MEQKDDTESPEERKARSEELGVTQTLCASTRG